ncbi:NEDD4-binding protein 1 [Lemmus lemmus]
MWGSNQNYSCNVDLESDGLSPSVASSSPKEVSFISRGATGHHQRSIAVPENGFQQQAEPLFPNNAKAAREQRSGCCSSLQPKPHCSPPQLLLPQLLPSATDARLAGASEHMDSSGMGVQRFRDTLKTPYKLKLKTEPGKADLKHIVIDGSNVAITDMQPLLNALPDVGMFDPGFRSPNTQVANTSHQPPSRNQGASSGSWLPQQPHFIPLATFPSIQQNLLGPAQRSSAETSQLRAALLKIFPDSEQKLTIDQILAAHPDMKDLNALSALVLD